jgi:hypothetical protein
VQHAEHVAADGEQHSGPDHRIVDGVRLAIAVVAAAAVCGAIWAVIPRTLHLQTGIVGYPTFSGFDYHRYVDAFVLVAAVLPALVFCFGKALTYVPGLGRRRVERAGLFPIGHRRDETENPSTDGIAWWCATAARLSLPAGTIALEVSASTKTATGASGAAAVGAVVYLGVVGITTVFLARRSGDPRRLLAGVNAVASISVVVGLSFVARATNVAVASTGRNVTYDWFPFWISLPVAAIALTAVILRGRRLGSDRLRRLEGDTLVVGAGLVLLFLLTAHLPGALTSFDAFDGSQYLAAPQLVFVHGELPWKGIFLLHGLIEDLFDGAIGMAIFNHSAWGTFAGLGVLAYPVGGCVYYLFAAYFSRRNSLVAFVTAVLIINGTLPSILRFVFLPLLVLAFDWMLRRPNLLRTSVFGASIVIEAILVPEFALMAAGLLGTLVVIEVVEREPGASWWAATRRIRRVIVSAACMCVPFLVYLVATGSLSGFVDYYRINGSDHALWGAIPIVWHDAGTRIELILPILLYLVALACMCRKFRRREGWTTTEWTLIAAATFVPLYAQKFLDRADEGHAVEVFTVWIPLVILAGTIVISRLDRIALSMVQRGGNRFATAATRASVSSPVGALGAVLVVVLCGSQLLSTVRTAPSFLHASAPTPPQVHLLGYAQPGIVDTAQVDELGRVLDAYAGDDGSVLDLSNEPGITYFLLNRPSPTPFFHMEAAETPYAQELAIADIARSRPRVAIFTNDTFGLYIYDGLTSQVRNYLVDSWVLDHYRPVVEVDGQVVLLRNDLVGHVPSVDSLDIPGTSTSDLYDAGQSCDFGAIPNYLAIPSSVTSEAPTAATLTGGRAANTEITGWAVDANELVPAKEVVAVIGRKVIASVGPAQYRLDIADFYKTMRVVDSGFTLDFELPAHRKATIYAINANGTASEIVPNGITPTWSRHDPQPRSIRTPDGVVHAVVVGRHLSGWVNTSAVVDHRLYTLAAPTGRAFSAFGWLRVVATSGLGNAYVTLGDVPQQSGHAVSFHGYGATVSSLTTPVGACLDWHGFPRSVELIESDGPPLRGVQLFR